MSKILLVENITSCKECPYCDWNEPTCEYICAKVKDGDDYITKSFYTVPHGETYDYNNPEHNQKIMPKWCPLPDMTETNPVNKLILI